MVLSNSDNVSTHDLEDIECHLFSLKLERDGTLDISGFAYVSKEKWRSRVVGVRLIRAGLMSREYSVQNLVDPRVNVHSNVQSQDRSTAAFRCCLDLRDLVVNQETETFDLGWNLEVVLEFGVSRYPCYRPRAGTFLATRRCGTVQPSRVPVSGYDAASKMG